MRAVKVFAPAKVNLTLHVTGQRADGYHLLDSLVMFADAGDRVTVERADRFALEVAGPMAAGVPSGDDNLVLGAARLFGVPVAIRLSKYLPMAAGLGGGSSDAAATALAMADLLGENTLPEGLTGLGADIRVCLMRQAARMQGIGTRVTPLPGLPPVWAVLANPGVGMATPAVFQALREKSNPPMPRQLPKGLKTADFINWLASQRNDLEAPARALQPQIGQTLAALQALPGARLVRMSGSGATCFALFDSRQTARAAAARLAGEKPGWWVQDAALR